MPKKPKSGPAAPDGEPKPRAEGDNTAKNKVSRVEDPLISGDVSKQEKGRNADEAAVDEAGQLTKKKPDVDLLH